MTKISALFSQKDFLVIVSLPQNDFELALVAFSCAPDAIKVHLNVEHKASGTRFGGWAEEKNTIDQILRAATCPVGLMPGAETMITASELEAAQSAGIDFIDIYDFHMPPWMLNFPITKMIAVGSGYCFRDVKLLETLGADMIEASIVPSADYRQPLTVKDLEAYRLIVESTALPVVVPSQKKIEPSDIALLKQVGVKGVILGTISLGDTPESFQQQLPQFVQKC